MAPLGTECAAWGTRPEAPESVDKAQPQTQSHERWTRTLPAHEQVTSNSVASKPATSPREKRMQGEGTTGSPQSRMHAAPPRGWTAASAPRASHVNTTPGRHSYGVTHIPPPNPKQTRGGEAPARLPTRTGLAAVPQRRRLLLPRVLLPHKPQLLLLSAPQQGQLLGVPAVEHGPQLRQRRLLLLLEVGLRQLQLRRVHVAETQAQRLQLQGGHRLQEREGFLGCRWNLVHGSRAPARMPQRHPTTTCCLHLLHEGSHSRDGTPARPPTGPQLSRPPSGSPGTAQQLPNRLKPPTRSYPEAPPAHVSSPST